MSIEEIIKGCKSMERKHQRELYLLTAEDLMRVAQRYMKDKDAAKDIFQEAYLRIFKKIHLFDPKKGSIGAWSARVVTNLALEQLRRNKVFSSVEDLPIALHPVEEDSVIDDMAADELLNTIHELPDSYRIIFLLSVVEGFSHQEISDQLGITASTSRSQLVRARAKLRSILQKNNNQNPPSYVEAK